MNDLRDRIAIVTGASSGIGRATALALARAGAAVVLAARRETELQTVAGEIVALGGRALVIPTDVARQDQVQRLVDGTLARWGRLDIVVANAGAYVRCRLASLLTPTKAEWDEKVTRSTCPGRPPGQSRGDWPPHFADVVGAFENSLRVNFFGALYAVLAALPQMCTQGSGHIVLVSSMDGKKGVPPDAPYVAAKFALAGFGDVLRQELHGTGVDVTTVFPGRVDTLLISWLKVPWISAKIPPEAVANAIVKAIRRRQAEVIVPFQARFLLWVNALSPHLGDWAVRTFRLEGWE